jgi:hypothetical protein
MPDGLFLHLLVRRVTPSDDYRVECRGWRPVRTHNICKQSHVVPC